MLWKVIGTKLKSGILLICVLLGTSALAQNTIKGKVFTPESHVGHNNAPGAHQGEEQFIPLPGATVIWKGIRSGTMTDAHGFFKLPAMKLSAMVLLCIPAHTGKVWIMQHS